MLIKISLTLLFAATMATITVAASSLPLPPQVAQPGVFVAEAELR